MYIDSDHGYETRAEVKGYVAELKAAYEDIIRGSGWMDEGSAHTFLNYLFESCT